MARKCKRFKRKRIRGHMRRVCVSYGKGSKRKRRSTKRRRSTASGGPWRRVSKKVALNSRTGKLKKGCKFGKNGQAYCRKAARRRRR